MNPFRVATQDDVDVIADLIQGKRQIVPTSKVGTI